MVIADLLSLHGNNFYINWAEKESILAFIQSEKWFEKYDSDFFDADIKSLNLIKSEWLNYVNTDLGDNLFKTDVLKYLNINESPYLTLLNDSYADY